MKKRHVVLIVIAFIVLALFAIVMGVGTWLTRGLEEMAQMQISDVDLSSLSDSTYPGNFKGYRWSNSVEVVIETNRISEIRVTEKHRFNREELIQELTSRIIGEQSIAV
ncbi:MAG TPA: hypothetical protein DCE14_06075, partial [Kosmotogaceae bacterium]|nr:hypothetical protein [Kosmotogaceae bacterium]